jgi:nucleoside-diphosphate-sugar epimerase
MPQQNTTSTQPVLLLTGATGQIGRLILRTWLQTGNSVVITLRDPERQWPTLRQWLTMQGVSSEGVQCVATDFSLPDFGWGAQEQCQLKSVTCVVHLAAMWGWQLSWPEANEVNVNGSLRLHAWASQRGIAGPFVGVCGFMSQVPGHLDSMGLRQPEVDWAYAAKKWGAYEISKLRAYLALSPSQRKEGDLPVTWIHPAVVIGDASLPGVPDQSAVVGILNSILRGLLRLVPGKPSDRVPWVTGQYVAAYAVALLLSSDGETIEHLLLDPNSPSLRTSVNVMSSAMRGPRAVGHLPKWVMSSVLKLPLVPDLLGTSKESLSFIVSVPPDPAASVHWGLRHGITHPDVMQSLDLTARHWQQRVLAAQVR